VLIDTGLGLADIAEPVRLGRLFLTVARPALDAAETAVRQVRQLGFAPEDIRHIEMTHLDLDHTGALADFPAAEVHVATEEYRAAMQAQRTRAQRRYVKVHWFHQPRWVQHAFLGDQWCGFDAVSTISGITADLRLISLPGHTRGHCGVAIRLPEKWLLFCGDAYHSRTEIEQEGSRGSLQQAAHWLLAADRRVASQTQSRLRQFAQDHMRDVEVFCAHDPNEFLRFAHSTLISPKSCATTRLIV